MKKIVFALFLSLPAIMAAAQDYRKTFDLMIFMGQSNMAGRGVENDKHPEDAPGVADSIDMEFRAYSDTLIRENSLTLYPR